MFICFEGIDGAGKSTQARMLQQRLAAEGRPAELVFDPGTTQIGTAIRQILLQNDAPISPAAQMLLFSAARAELAVYIQNLIEQGYTVICDRWLLSTLVYQGEINNISHDLITQVFRETSFVQPDMCFLLDLDPDTACSRMVKRAGKQDRYEKRCAHDKQRMRAAYLRHAQERPNAQIVHVVSAELSPQETHEHVYRLVTEAFSNRTESTRNANNCGNMSEKS